MVMADADIHAAHETLKKMYNQGLFALHSDGFPDPTWVSFHINTLTSTALPILEALITSASHEDGYLPHEWVVGVARLIGQTVQDLQDMAQQAARGISHMTLWQTMWKHGLKWRCTVLSDDNLNVLGRGIQGA
ncbi:hypothetical protein EDC04DRAFT_2609426 [Pisolithus marmoratus]|nr:hypothetical protein EDC04DRAFT_2609426 [Pisolithus marmoratus]